MNIDIDAKGFDALAETESRRAASDDIGKRADVFISEKFEMSRSAAASAIESGAATVNGKAMRKNYRIAEGDDVSVVLPEPQMCEAQPEDIPIDIVYEDDDVIIINKPQGMVVHPAPGHQRGTLVSALLYHCEGCLPI